MFCSSQCVKQKIKKLLVANRGEIACRVFRTCQTLGIQTVAVCCEGEPGAKHVREADEAAVLGPPPATSSYLRGDRIIEVAQNLGVDAIHPGYGFLSENAGFAKAVEASGMRFIGPPTAAIEAMGSKRESKCVMEQAGVPVLPGYHGTDQAPERLSREAKAIGFPVMIKAVSGGGGKGMKIVLTEEDFFLMLESAKREATNHFGDDAVILERYVACSRHIECQVFFDRFGNGVHFFERDCSVQRRHQKVLEEAPAPHLTPELRKQIGEVAVKAGSAVGYVGAGTVEFMFDAESGQFYFMEMNTRLQVEHPVTEEICRIRGEPVDLVQLQILVAQNTPFWFAQEDITIAGCAIEARLYAESPEREFLPDSGPLVHLNEPLTGVVGKTKVRLDSGFGQGDEVLVFYDPMLAKVIVWANERETALAQMQVTLQQFRIVGMHTNVEFLLRCFSTPAFQVGGVTTNFIAEHSEQLLAATPISSTELNLAAVGYFCYRKGSGTFFRLNYLAQMTVTLKDEKQCHPVVVQASNKQHLFTCDPEGKPQHILVRHIHRDDSGLLKFTAVVDNNHVIPITLVVEARFVSLLLPHRTLRLGLQEPSSPLGIAPDNRVGTARVCSAMPGKVRKLLVKEKEVVQPGQAVLMMEAMKMEHPMKAEKAGIVQYAVNEGELVASGQLLFTVEE